MNQFDLIDIKELLPQKEPFIMVGQLLHFDMERAVVKTIIKEDNLFVENRYLTHGGLIENIAQTCATRIGYINKYILNKAIQIGFIGAIRNLKILSLPKVGDIIITEIIVEEEIFGMTLVTATVKRDEEILAEGEMKIAIKEV